MGQSVEDGRIWEVSPDQRFGNAAAQTVFDAMIEEFRRGDCVVHTVDIGTAAGERAGGGHRGADGLSMMARGPGVVIYRYFNDLEEAAGRLLRETS